MVTMITWDGGVEDTAAFAKFLVWREPALMGQHPQFVTELYPEDFLRWRVLRFMREGFANVTILGLIEASAEVRERVAADDQYLQDMLTDASMEPFIMELLAMSSVLPG